MNDKDKLLMEYLDEIKTLVEYHNINSYHELVLTILAICEVNNYNYEEFKKYLLNCDINQETPTKETI